MTKDYGDILKLMREVLDEAFAKGEAPKPSATEILLESAEMLRKEFSDQAAGRERSAKTAGVHTNPYMLVFYKALASADLGDGKIAALCIDVLKNQLRLEKDLEALRRQVQEMTVPAPLDKPMIRAKKPAGGTP